MNITVLIISDKILYNELFIIGKVCSLNPLEKFIFEMINGIIKTKPWSFIDAAIATAKLPKIALMLFEIPFFIDKRLNNKHIVEKNII